MTSITLDDIQKQLNNLIQEFNKKLSTTQNLPELDQLKSAYLGKKSPLTNILRSVSSLPNEQKPQVGKLANETKLKIQQNVEEKKNTIELAQLESQLNNISTDPTLPPILRKQGQLHPITQTITEITQILSKLGFSIRTGPEIETEHFNFEALNIPENHPARDMHDTFYFDKPYLLRTHTSPVQIHVMENEAPPIKIIIPGKVYRCDADVTHSPVFHQIEGLYISKKVTISHLKATLEHFLRELFGPKQGVRFRPSYFPFTEPSTEVDVECFSCKGKGCSLCKQTGWLEILGAGIVHPNVLKATNLDPEEYSGFAFGLGVDRIAMLKYKISDIRLLYENDLKFLEQF